MPEGRRSRGASLLDVLISATIFSTLLAIGLPSLARLKTPYAVRNTALQIEAALQLARQRAIARNTSYRVTFNSSAGTYVLEQNTGGNTWVADGATQKVPYGVSLGTIPTNPVFDTRGTLPAAINVPVSMSGAHSRTVTINVLGKTTIS